MSRYWLIVPVLLPAMLFAADPARGQARSPDKSFRDCQDCPLMLPLPAGRFTMGVTADEEEREGVAQKFRGWSTPQHGVTIPGGRAMGKYEVTRAEFGRFVRDTGYDAGSSCYVQELDRSTNQWGYQERGGKNWRDPGFSQGDDEPVVCVSWTDAKSYAAWLSRKTNRSYRLPSEAEWEYAARAGTEGARYWGGMPDLACDYANVADIKAAEALNWTLSSARTFLCNDGYVNTAPVGRYRPNSFGLHDMLGNAFEWVDDCWNENYASAPADGSPWTTGDCARRPVRGGSWISIAWNVRAGGRGWIVTNYRGASTGFRVIRDP